MVDTVYKRTRESAVPRYAGTLFRTEQDRRGRLYDEPRLSYAARSDSPGSDDGGECNIQQCRRCSLLLDFSVSSDMQPARGKASSYLSRLFSLFPDVSSAALKPLFHQLLWIFTSRLFPVPSPLSRCTSRFRHHDGDEDGWCRHGGRLSFTRLPPVRCNYCKLPPRQRGFPPFINFVRRIRTRDRIFICDKCAAEGEGGSDRTNERPADRATNQAIGADVIAWKELSGRVNVPIQCLGDWVCIRPAYHKL